MFGEFLLHRTAYGSREGQKIACVPLDNRLQLPASVFSYLLQDWDQSLCAEEAFGQASRTVARMLGLSQSVDSLEHMNEQMAASVQSYRENRPLPQPEDEGEVLVISADGKPLRAFPLEVDQVASPEVVYQLNRLLVQVMEHGTGRPGRALLPRSPPAPWTVEFPNRGPTTRSVGWPGP